MTPKPSNAKHAATYRAKQAARVKAMREALQWIGARAEKMRNGTDDWFELVEFETVAKQALAPQGEK